MKKFLFLVVPTTLTYFPEMAIPSLTAQLRSKNYDVSVMDLNIDFFHHIYNQQYLEKSLENAKVQYEELKAKKDSFYNNQDIYENKILARKYDNLDDFFENHIQLGEKIPSSIEKAMQVIKNENLFYNPKLLQYAHQVFKSADKLSCLPYSSFNPYDTYATYYEDLCKIIFDKEQNIFIEYFEQKLDEIKEINPDYIGISISYRQQMIAGLTVANLLKKHTNAHINIGGNYISRLIEYIPYYPDFFNIFADSISFGEGENSILDFARFIDGEISLDKVPQLIYQDKETGQVKQNNTFKKVVLSRVQTPDYSDYDLDKYLLPEKVLPIQIQRGCYWNKCAFCSFSHAKTPSVKKMESVIEEIKHYVDTYGVRMFMIIDEAVTPYVLNKLADTIIESKLDVRFFTQSKFEKEFDYKLLKKLFDAGFRNMWWGLESANERVQNLMNKGISLKYVPEILKNSDKVGILNALFCMCGFPTATYEEDMDTYNFIRKHNDIVHHFLISIFGPVEYSPIYDNEEKYKIKIQKDNSKTRVSLDHEYDKLEGASYQKSQEISKLFTRYYYNDKFKYIFAPYYYVLYSNKLGLKYVKDNLLKIEKKKSVIVNLFSKIFRK